MNMKDVKAITIPQGSVKKIEDSNGNIIWGSQSAFPYRRLEYIESTDNSAKGKYCIQFDFTIVMNSSSNVHVDIQFQLTKATFDRSTGQYYGAIMAAQNLDCRFGYANNYNSNFLVYLNGASTYANITNYAWNTNKHNIGVYKNNCWVDGTNRGACLSGSISGNKVSLFNQKYNGSEWSILGKFYSLKMYKTGTNYHMVYPCQRKSDGVLGVYDTVGQKFYVNSGAGTFTAGPVVDEYWDLTTPD